MSQQFTENTYGTTKKENPCYICAIKESPIWYTTGGSSVLGTIVQYTNKLVIINPYDHCVANKIVNGNQCTIIWHVDDLKISHIVKNVVENVIKNLEKKFGK